MRYNVRKNLLLHMRTMKAQISLLFRSLIRIFCVCLRTILALKNILTNREGHDHNMRMRSLIEEFSACDKRVVFHVMHQVCMSQVVTQLSCNLTTKNNYDEICRPSETQCCSKNIVVLERKFFISFNIRMSLIQISKSPGVTFYHVHL